MGPEADNIFKSFTFDAEADKKEFDIVLAKYDGYFYPKRNVIHECTCFYQRVQRPGEKAEMFIRALYEMTEHCEFGTTREEHIRDRIVVGILDKEVSRKLQLMADLTLAQTIQTVRQSEEVALQVHQQGEACASVQEIHRKPLGKDQPLIIVLQSAYQQSKLEQYGKSVVFLDATYSVYALVARDSHGHGFPLSYMILSTENTAVLQKALAAFSKANPSFCPRSSVLLCWFHVTQAVHRWITKRDSEISRPHNKPERPWH
ncbi:hypothetical protein N1851_021899 [Merluccius polli]|uniref:ZSWIM1/3 RNaseH-like domain-containing protein n=1 Tax=Merluccius polli TaxID=89951 RepID=A0AA47NZ15_MERPO|nr:hypothetical protein N1851_021899 [Merluccius polli]